jgi:hypothetical protein
MGKLTVELTRKQLTLLEDILLEYQDEGGCCEGWASNELLELRRIILDESEFEEDLGK